ncbi:MAG: protein kinase domain-containing protein [Isosphaeraceae bacterium]
MTQGPYCPDHADLEAYVRGRASGATAEVVKVHLNGCRCCSETVERLRDELVTGRTDPESTPSDLEDASGRWTIPASSGTGGAEGTAGSPYLFTRIGPDPTTAVGPALHREATEPDEQTIVRAMTVWKGVEGPGTGPLLPVVPGYEIVRELGRGGMGVVYEAVDHARNARVALKTVRKTDASAIYRFKHEFRALADLSHPNLIPLFELSVTGDIWFLTMPLIEGVDFLCHVRPEPPARDDSLRDSARDLRTTHGETTRGTLLDGGEPGARANRHSEKTTDPDRAAPSLGSLTETSAVESNFDLSGAGPMPPRTATVPFEIGTTVDVSRTADAGLSRRRRTNPRRGRLDFPLDLERLRRAFPQLVRGVLALHAAGKLHRDIKPSNVLVRDDGTVLLLDFGLVAELATPQSVENRPGSGPLYDSDDSMAGTASYMAPEQAAGEPLMPASDWYAVGVMLFESLTGRLPYQGRLREVLLNKQKLDAPEPIELDPTVPPDLNRLCVELLRRNPAERLKGSEILVRLGEDVSGEFAILDDAPAAGIPLVGRQAELEVLESSFAEVLSGKTAIVEVHGRSGAGKSSLVQHFLDGLGARRDVVVLAGRCFEQESIPYKGVDPLMDVLTRYLGRFSYHEARALLPPDIGALARIFPVLEKVDAIFGLRHQPSQSRDLRELRERAFGALRELMARLAASRPVVLCIDDVQWSDLDSAALLAEIFRAPDSPRLMLLVCYRSEYAESSAGLRALREALPPAGRSAVWHEVRVSSLPTDAARELAMLLLKSHGTELDLAGRADQIARESGGNPYFVYELARHVAEGVSLPSRGDGLNLDEVLWRRIERLPEESRRFLEMLAVAGQPVRMGLAYAASDLMTSQRQVVAGLRAARLVRGTGPRLDDDVETYHDRIREVIVGVLDSDRRRHHHGRLAETLESAGSADPETLAVHFLGAGRRSEAGRYYAEAADLAASALAFDRAAKLYRRSIELRPLAGVEGRRMRVRLAETLANAGRCVEAAEEYLVAAADADTAEGIELERSAAFHYCAGGEMDLGREALRRVLGRVGMKLPDSKLRALALLLFNRFRLARRGLHFRERDASQIDPQELMRIDLAWAVGTGLASKNIIVGPAFHTLNLLWALRAGEPFRIARALCWEAAQTSIEGISVRRQTAKMLEAADALCRRLGQPYIRALLLLARGYRDFCFGRWPRGRAVLDQAIEIFRERCTGAAWELAQSNTYALWCLSYEGNWPEIRRRCDRLLKVSHDTGDLFTQVNLGTFMQPLCLLADDQPEEARRLVQDSIGRWSPEEYNIQNMTGLMGATYVDLYRGDPQAALARHCREWPALKGAFILRSQICRLLVGELRARSALGLAFTSRKPAALLREVERRARAIESEDMPYANGLAMLLHAGLAVHRRDGAEAVRRLSQAVRLFEDIPMQLFAAVARRRLGELLEGDKGRELVAAVDRWMRDHGIRNPDRMAIAITPWYAR